MTEAFSGRIVAYRAAAKKNKTEVPLATEREGGRCSKALVAWPLVEELFCGFWLQYKKNIK